MYELHYGASALADELIRSPLEIVCVDLGGEGSRRLCAELRDRGAHVSSERTVSAALGAAAAGATVWVFASGAHTVELARALREAQRVGVALTGVVASHGDDVGAVLPAADGADLAALASLASAPAERWTLSSPSEVAQWTQARLRALCSPPCASAVCAFDLRAVALRAWVAPPERGALPSFTLHGEGEGGALLISCVAGAQAAVAVDWLAAEGVSARAMIVRSLDDASITALCHAVSRASLVLVHRGGDERVWSAVEGACRALGRDRRSWIALDAAHVADADRWCEQLARLRDHRAALEAASRALRVQLAGDPATRSAAVHSALSVLALAGMRAWAERVEPTHALITVDVGPSRQTGATGWMIVCEGLPVRAPIEPCLGAATMIVDVGRESSLLAERRVATASDQASLVIAAVLAELEAREAAPTAVEALQNAVVRSAGSDAGTAWGEVRERARHLRSLR